MQRNASHVPPAPASSERDFSSSPASTSTHSLSQPQSAEKASASNKKHFYIIGGGIAGLNTAVLLIREKIPGNQITIFEGNKECGGIFYRDVSNDNKSFFAHTVRTFDEPSYFFTQRAWRQAGIWNTAHLISRNLAHPRETIPGDMKQAFVSIAMKSDAELERMAIAALLPKRILESAAFRYFFHLTGLFEHHAALGLKRYMTHTHSNIPHNWVLRSATCDYESIVEPLVAYLKREGVTIQNETWLKKLHINRNHVDGINDIKLAPDDQVIVTVGANVAKDLFPEEVLIHDKTLAPLSPDTPLATSVKQPHSSVWLLAHPDLASRIEALFPGSEKRDFIHVDVRHPWQITFISLREKYYRDQPAGHRLFYIALNDLSKKGVHLDRVGLECTNAQLIEEVLKRLNLWDLVQQSPDKYTATVDSRAREFKDRDSAPIVRFMPGESEKILVYPDTKCDNLAVIGERVKAYNAPVPTTEWVTETGHRAIQYLLHGTRYRMTAREYSQQESDYSMKFVWNWMKYQLNLFGPNFKSSVSAPERKETSYGALIPACAFLSSSRRKREQPAHEMKRTQPSAGVPAAAAAAATASSPAVVSQKKGPESGESKAMAHSGEAVEMNATFRH